MEISERLCFADPKIISLKADLGKVNENLPASVYIPFVQSGIRNYALLNIIVSETKVFSTKERAPFYICLEIYRPEEGKLPDAKCVVEQTEIELKEVRFS